MSSVSLFFPSPLSRAIILYFLYFPRPFDCLYNAWDLFTSDLALRKDTSNISPSGLGIGTAPNALIAHGINTTIVELDPVVHYFATKYFNLSSDHIAAIDDAVFYVDEKARSHPGSYDYIIHDVFTGGAEPVMLFTLEFLEGLKSLLTDNGVVAIVRNTLPSLYQQASSD